MKKHLCYLVLITICCTSFILQSDDWGFVAHERINRMAVYTLPTELIPFFKKHQEYLTKHAVDADKRRYASKQEAPRHYIDVDHYGIAPFDEVPRKWIPALSKYTEVFVVTTADDTLQLFGHELVDFSKDTLVLKGEAVNRLFQTDSVQLSKKRYWDFVRNNINSQFYELEWSLALENLDTLFQAQVFKSNCKVAFAEKYLSKYGIVPWHIEKLVNGLVYAFKEKDEEKILRLCSDIGHYVGDSHVPLHTTLNYNGQLTGQDGIHGFWESRLPELFMEDYNFIVGKAEYIDDLNSYLWDIVLASHSHLDSVLLIEKELTERFSAQKFCFETRGEQTVKTYCKDFSTAYHKRLNGMVENRMQASIKAVGDVWMTAWVNAGQPDLMVLSGKEKRQRKKNKRKE